MRPALSLVLVALAAACGGGTEVAAGGDGAADQRYVASATVLESPEHGPQLCVGGVAESYPPQCGGPDLVGWSWDDVDGEESASGTTWGTYRVVGTWDGDALTLTEAPGPPDPPDEGSWDVDLSTPCPAPPGGWVVVDDTKVAGWDDAGAYAQAQPDFAGMWIDQSINPASEEEEPDEMAMNDPTKLVLNLRFTGDLDRHEREVRERWGGALCLTEAAQPLAELRVIQEELQAELDATGSSADEVTGVVHVSVVFADPGLQASLDERYGPGTVVVTAALRPVG